MRTNNEFHQKVDTWKKQILEKYGIRKEEFLQWAQEQGRFTRVISNLERMLIKFQIQMVWKGKKQKFQYLSLPDLKKTTKRFLLSFKWFFQMRKTFKKFIFIKLHVKTEFRGHFFSLKVKNIINHIYIAHSLTIKNSVFLFTMDMSLMFIPFMSLLTNII